MTSKLLMPIELPCGAVLANRIAKAAMTEGLADLHDDATGRLETLYRRWSLGGAGLHLTGNVQVDRRYLERPGNVVIDRDSDIDALARWAEAGTQGGNHLWVQLSHPGRQCTSSTSKNTVAPSEVPVKIRFFFGRPRALKSDEIRDVIGRFAYAAGVAKRAGFTGVQIHSAHGYLSSQFLSPLANQRTDEWGGPLANRARFLLQTVDAVRDEVGPDFPVCVKLNSADFQKGGFSEEDSSQVVEWLGERGIDLLEISGGTYERVAFVEGNRGSGREAYFLDYAERVRAVCKPPLMVTGGFRTPRAMEDALDGGKVDVIGIGRPFCVEPEFPLRLQSGSTHALPAPEKALVLGPGPLSSASGSATLRAFNNQAATAWFYKQILLLADGREPDARVGLRRNLIRHLVQDQFAGRRRQSRVGDRGHESRASS